jgi:hypothetical protein
LQVNIYLTIEHNARIGKRIWPTHFLLQATMWRQAQFIIATTPSAQHE